MIYKALHQSYALMTLRYPKYRLHLSFQALLACIGSGCRTFIAPIFSWQLAVGSWQLAVGSWQLAVRSSQSAGWIMILNTEDWILKTIFSWQSAKCYFSTQQNISFSFLTQNYIGGFHSVYFLFGRSSFP